MVEAEKAMSKRVFIDDLEGPYKEILKTALNLFAKKLPASLGGTEEERIKSVKKLWERGYLEAIYTGDRVGFRVCAPGNAVQIKSHGNEVH
jgi:hypothetical protein